MGELPDEDPARGDPGATRSRTGGQPNESIQQANARGRVVINGSAEAAPITDEDRRSRYIEAARKARSEMGILGHADAAVRGFSNSVTFGLADKLAAGGDALFGSGDGATMGERYRNNLAKQEAIDQADSEVHGTAQKLGEVGAEFVPYERLIRFGARGERIIRRVFKRRKGKKCPTKCSGRPVDVASGAKITADVDFSLPGALPVDLTRIYMSDLDFEGPLGRGRMGAFDEAIVLGPDGDLSYLMASGLDAAFARPAPNPGETSRNARHPRLSLSAEAGDEFAVRDRDLIKRFVKFEPNLWLLVEFRDLNANRAALTRDERGLLNRLDRSDGFAFTFENDARGLRVATTLHAPTGEARLISRFAYDERENMVEARNSYRPSFRYEYDAEGRFAAFEDGVKVRNEYAYDGEGRVSRVSTPGGRFDHTFAYRTEERETVLSFTARKDAATRYVFDENDALVSETDGLGHTWTYERDALGELLAEVDPEGGRTSYGYDAFGALAFVVDPEGRRTSYHHDSEGRLERHTDPQGASWEWGYDERGNLSWARDPLGHRTDFVNDAAGQPTGLMRHDGLIEKREYDAQHRLARHVNFRGGVTTFERDAFGRVVKAIDPAGAVTRFVFDETPGADFWTASAYVRPDGVVLTRTVDPARAVITLVDGEGRRGVYRFGPFDLLEEIEDPQGARIRFAYDHQERLVRVENQLGRAWTFERDAVGRVTRETDFDGLTIDYAHDRAGRVVERRHADGARIGLSYDRSGRLVQESIWAPAATEPTVARYWYDGRGLLAGAQNDTGQVEFERDAAGRVTRETADGRRIESTYDCCGNRTSRRIGDRLVTSLYDPLGAVTSIAIADHAPLTFRRDKLGRELRRESVAGYALDQTWDAVGRLTGQSSLGALDHGAASWTADVDQQFAIERAYQWNRSLEPVAVKDRFWGDTTYAYQDNGQVTEARHGDGQTERFSYDPARSVVSSNDASARFASWLREPGGRVTIAYGPLGERISLTHDERRRVVERRVERDGFRPKLWRYGWDARDQMVACETPGGETWSYAYDPFGRRVRKVRLLNEREQAWVRTRHPKLVPAAFERGSTDLWPERPPGVSETDQSPPVVGVAYLWDGDLLVEVAPLRLDGTADWDAATRWHYEPGSFRPLAKEEPDGRLLNVVTDALGTPRELVDETGRVVWAGEQWFWGGLRRVWTADNDNKRGGAPRSGGGRGRVWGALVLKDEPEGASVAEVCPIRFQGQWEDQETALFYNRFRHYDAGIAQYVGPDPIGVVGGAQSYAYVSNPGFEIDPFGLSGGSATLRRNLDKGGCVPSGVAGVPWQAQHNIPQEVWGDNQKFFDDIGMGADPKTGNPRDAASNGAALPRDEADGKRLGMCCHRGSHPNYSADVRSRVEQIRDSFNAGEISADKARSQIGNLQKSLGSEMGDLPAGCRIS